MKAKYYFTILLIYLFTTRCEKGLNDFGGSDYTGKGGSLARFTISGDNLYIVDLSNLKTFDISQPSNPVLKMTNSVGSQIETIFSLNNLLFMGSRQGMYIYSISDPNNPYQLSNYQHIYSCDPVVANEDYAYVTLSTGTGCRQSTNELQIIDISHPESPFLLKSYVLSKPKGLGISGNTLFICDNGLKIYDVTNPYSIQLKKTYSIDANDVIPLDTLLLVVGSNKLSEYKFVNNDIEFLSSISTIPSKK